ncbi:MAG: DeoR/GlpR transcriptional regulator [Opitutales bacterium]|nr:DeoR/GlpR transcriptional regulator [Opitutales bacterium]
MRRKERQRAILAMVKDRGEIALEDACRAFRVSPATGRRDFAEIAVAGLAEKTWGGLRSRSLADGGDMIPSDERERARTAEKEAIARAAAALVADGDVVTIDGGTTTAFMAPYLANRPVRILTNSILIAHRIDRLRTKPTGAEVFLTGGFLYPRSGLLVGPQAVESLSQYHAAWAFLSAGGLDETGGTNTNQLVVESERTMIRMAEKAVILADVSKWRRREMVRAFAWSEVAMLVTDAVPPVGAFPDPGKTRLLVAGE